MVVDLPEMTYLEVMTRMIELSIKYGTRDQWIHPDFEIRVFEFAQRLETRFTDCRDGTFTSRLPSPASLSENPEEFKLQVGRLYPL